MDRKVRPRNPMYNAIKLNANKGELNRYRKSLGASPMKAPPPRKLDPAMAMRRMRKEKRLGQRDMLIKAISKKTKKAYSKSSAVRRRKAKLAGQ